MITSSGALREGILYDLIGRIRHEDRRDQTVSRFVERYHVDLDQSARVERTALALLDQVAAEWKLETPTYRNILTWAARLHEIGQGIAYAGYHKHGAYIVANSDMPGFSNGDKQFLAALIQSHRRKIRKVTINALGTARAASVLHLVVILRLAVLLHRSRSPQTIPKVELTFKKDRVELLFPKDWLKEHPLSQADVDEEVRFLKSVRIAFQAR